MYTGPVWYSETLQTQSNWKNLQSMAFTTLLIRLKGVGNDLDKFSQQEIVPVLHIAYYVKSRSAKKSHNKLKAIFSITGA